ncbi:MAG TPA: hypothetical protein VFI65_32675 [Streptosporangiaceae bacterium]|nr:hypothetical protein [Streptosporangiaceae bacterium]
MSSDGLQACRLLARTQDGVISRKQALDCGASPDVIDALLRAERWQMLHRGVYSVFTGQPSKSAALWAAVHRAGPGAALSHGTAAELFGLSDQRCAPIHLSVPVNRQVTSMNGAVVHRSTRLADAIHPSLLPPRTRLEETVIDLVDQAATFDAALSVVCSATQRRLTTPAKLLVAMSRRSKLRWRSELIKALAEVGAGVHSILEYRYLHRVERPHGLPTAVRQARLDADGRNRYLDNLYCDFALCVELDGLQAHPDEQRWQDLRRINSIIENGNTVLCYGWIDVNQHACETAVQVGAVLQHLGWQRSPRPCSPVCPARNYRLARA